MAVEPNSGSRAVQPAGSASPPARGGGMESAGFGKRLMTMLRAVYHMLRKGLCRKRLMMDLHLLLGRGKLAGKAFRDLLVAAHHHHHHHNLTVVPRPSSSSSSSSNASRASTSAALPASATSGGGGLSFVGPYDPRDVEFSCTTTPSYSFGGGHPPGTGPARALFPFRFRGRGGARAGGAGAGCDGLDFAQVARALEKMQADDEASAAGSAGADRLALESASPSPSSVAGATPSPMLALSLGRSPVGARRLRVTDSPFPVDPPEGLDARADSTFDAFINKFYETLRLQQADATPDNRARRRG